MESSLVLLKRNSCFGFYAYCCISIFLLTSTVQAQNRNPRQNQGFVRVSNSDKLSVQLHCASKEMHAILRLNTGPFYDYISVGSLGDRPECRYKGNGSSIYELQVHLMGDICGTEMITPGTFQNIIRIGSHPTVVLDSDERIIIRCLYGPPKVDQPPFPPILPDSPQQIQTTRLAPRQHQPTESPKPALASEHVILIVFLVLILALLFLLCGCLYFFFKRRKVRLEKRNKLLIAVPPGSEIGKLGFWWPGKPGLSNDALLSHDYMISTNSTREPLSVSVESPAGTSSSGGQSSRGSPGDPGSGSNSSNHRGQQVFVHETKHMIPRAHGENHVGRLVQSLQSIPEERHRHRNSPQSDIPVYGKIDKRDNSAGIDHHDGRGSEQILQVHTVTASNSRLTSTEVRSVTEIYKSPSDRHGGGETASVSTLDGVQYAPGSSVMSATYTGNSDHRGDELPSAGGSNSGGRSLSRSPDPDLYIKAVENNRGVGPHRLTDDDVERWQGIITNDGNIRQAVIRSRTLEDFELISRQSPYDTMYSREKWAIIVQSLFHVAFMRKLNDMIDHQAVKDQKSGVAGQNQSETLGYNGNRPTVSMGSKFRGVIKPGDPNNPRGRLATVDGLAAELRQKDHRLFTRDSYQQVKEQIESPHEHSPMPFEQNGYPEASKYNTMDTNSTFGGISVTDRSTTELAEPVATISAEKHQIHPAGILPNRHFRERSSSETFENPPQLSVYLGNVSNRNIHESVPPGRLPDQDSLYNAVPGATIMSDESLPHPPPGF